MRCAIAIRVNPGRVVVASCRFAVGIASCASCPMRCASVIGVDPGRLRVVFSRCADALCPLQCASSAGRVRECYGGFLFGASGVAVLRRLARGLCICSVAVL